MAVASLFVGISAAGIFFLKNATIHFHTHEYKE